LNVSNRPLVFVCGLTLGDYLLWNWSLNGSHDVLGLISGLTLPPLAVACVVLLAMSLARVVARSRRRDRGLSGRRGSRPQTGRGRGANSARLPTPGEDPTAAVTPSASVSAGAAGAATAPAGRSSGKLAA
jgi:hypothetical protein